MPSATAQLTLFDGWCQRWNQHQDSWQHTDDDWIQPHRYQVVPLDATIARAFTTLHHYSRAWPATQLRYGLIEDGVHLVGTCALGVPMRKEVLTRLFPAFEAVPAEHGTGPSGAPGPRGGQR